MQMSDRWTLDQTTEQTKVEHHATHIAHMERVHHISIFPAEIIIFPESALQMREVDVE